METARLLLDKTLEAYSEKAERAMRILEQGFDDATAVMAIPDNLRTPLICITVTWGIAHRD